MQHQVTTTESALSEDEKTQLLIDIMTEHKNKTKNPAFAHTMSLLIDYVERFGIDGFAALDEQLKAMQPRNYYGKGQLLKTLEQTAEGRGLVQVARQNMARMNRREFMLTGSGHFMVLAFAATAFACKEFADGNNVQANSAAKYAAAFSGIAVLIQMLDKNGDRKAAGRQVELLCQEYCNSGLVPTLFSDLREKEASSLKR